MSEFWLDANIFFISSWCSYISLTILILVIAAQVYSYFGGDMGNVKSIWEVLEALDE